MPLGYMGHPFEVARVAVFLASDQSQYMTAQTVSVDGGNVEVVHVDYHARNRIC